MGKLEKSKNELIKLLLEENDALRLNLKKKSNKVDPKTFRERRKALKIPMKTICDYIGVAESTISSLENCKSDAYFSTVMAVEDYLFEQELKHLNNN